MSSDPPETWIWALLDAVEDVATRMIRGIGQFVFRRIPRWIWDFLWTWSPTLVKFFRVAAILGVWAALTFSASVLAVAIPGRIERALEIAGVSDPSGSLPTAVWTCHAWTVLALLGSAWGLWTLRRRSRQRRNGNDGPGEAGAGVVEPHAAEVVFDAVPGRRQRRRP